MTDSDLEPASTPSNFYRATEVPERPKAIADEMSLLVSVKLGSYAFARPEYRDWIKQIMESYTGRLIDARTVGSLESEIHDVMLHAFRHGELYEKYPRHAPHPEDFFGDC